MKYFRYEIFAIYDTSSAIKFYCLQLRLCGYGGRGSVEVVSGRRMTGPGSGGECWVDLGGITRGKRITAKISVYNSGLREAFVTATCYPGRI